jgi:hypothetical protein
MPGLTKVYNISCANKMFGYAGKTTHNGDGDFASKEK